MKNVIIIFINLIYSFFAFSQGNTKITLKIPQLDTEKLEAQIFVENPMLPINTGFYQDTLEIKNGQCQFLIDIHDMSFISLTLNEKFITFPGFYSVLVAPGDNLIFELPAISEAKGYGFGIDLIKISGKGSEKINLAKKMMVNCFRIFNTDPDYQKQSLSYIYETTDKKLNVVDSIYNSDKSVKKDIRDLTKALLYGDLMVSLYRSSLRSENDSLRSLFTQYIIKKKRMDIFYKKGIINYSGSGSIGSYFILSAYKNPATMGGDDFSKKHILEYAQLINIGLKDDAEIRDYLLSKFVKDRILNKFDDETKNLYQFYIDHVDFNNPNYKNVVETYEEIERKFAVGKPFYNFSLPDSTGKYFSLKDFKGKVLIIDFWYNGCGGCKLIVPALKDVENELTGSNIQFISIGIDSRDYWLKGIGKYSNEGSLQLYTNEETDKHPMIKYLNIHSYPRLIIVDKEGNILPAPPDPRSNRKEFVKLIQTYL
ncbi:TlpA disulfide reductase family protein [Sphingobacterium sp.]|uniref:TlpA family protein disulfide reductase n=1 Tax=Sphingobacterium sp. TaxID=341027 RepID=UPI0028989618|nr:TlpA disulfide reductase family protein [Sphingobacterium sp.]